MKITEHLKLKKPDLTDYVNVGDLNDNMDTVDEEFNTLKENFNNHNETNGTLLKKGHVQLSNSTNSTSDTMAATPSAVKKAMDKANEAFTSASNGKKLVGEAITGVDGTVEIPNEPTFQDLATAIGSISTGKKWESGKSIPNSEGVIRVFSLNFRPAIVIVRLNTSGHSQAYYSLGVVAGLLSSSPISVAQGSSYRKDASFSVTDSSFSIKVYENYSSEYNWIAFE